MRFRNVACAVLVFALIATTPTFAQAAEGFQTKNSIPVGGESALKYGRLPLVFEANQGQAEPSVRFLFRGGGYTALLTSDGMVLSSRPSKVEPFAAATTVQTSTVATPPATIVRFRLSGAAKNQTVVGEDLQPGKVNYFIGDDPAQWRTNVATYRRVRYKNVYPGIDLVYYGNHRQLEYDFVISPGADPRRIQFDVQGAKDLQLNPEGDLILQTGAGKLYFHSPAVYQEFRGKRVPIDGTYVITDSMHVAFRLAAYDPNKPLVIDPVLVYGTYMGGDGNDQPTGLAVDGTGSVYMVGYTNSADFALTTIGAP